MSAELFFQNFFRIGENIKQIKKQKEISNDICNETAINDI